MPEYRIWPSTTWPLGRTVYPKDIQRTRTLLSQLENVKIEGRHTPVRFDEAVEPYMVEDFMSVVAVMDIGTSSHPEGYQLRLNIYFTNVATSSLKSRLALTVHASPTTGLGIMNEESVRPDEASQILHEVGGIIIRQPGIVNFDGLLAELEP